MNILRMLLVATMLMLSNFISADQHRTDAPKWFLELYTDLKTTFTTYYPKCKSSLAIDKISFEYNTNIFYVRIPSKTGQLQRPVKERGPNKGGILAHVLLQKGKYIGAATVPQTFDRGYYKILLLAPYSANCDCHLRANLYFPSDVDQKFLQKFRETLEGFATSRHLSSARDNTPQLRSSGE